MQEGVCVREQVRGVVGGGCGGGGPRAPFRQRVTKVLLELGILCFRLACVVTN